MGSSIDTGSTGRVNSVEEFLEHFGVKGMKWGVRKQGEVSGKEAKGELVLSHKFKSGDQVSIYKNPPSFIPRIMSRISPQYKKDVANYPQFTFRDKSGVKVGTGAFVRESRDSLYLDWIGIKKDHRGKGYATAGMKGVIKYAQNEGVSKLKLDVPGNAMDAQHIYAKLGFKRSGDDDVTPGNPEASLYGMELSVPKLKHAEESSDTWEEDFANEFAELLIKNLGASEGGMQHSTPEDVLAHFGIKGMRWGVKKSEVKPSSDAAKTIEIKTRAKKGKVKSLSNAELQAAINRMQLEQNFKRLAVNDKPAVTRFISSTLLEIGKREVQSAVAKKVASTIARKVVTGGLG